MMSIVTENTKGNVVIYTKGADSNILKKLKRDENYSKVLKENKGYLKLYSKEVKEYY